MFHLLSVISALLIVANEAALNDYFPRAYCYSQQLGSVNKLHVRHKLTLWNVTDFSYTQKNAHWYEMKWRTKRAFSHGTYNYSAAEGALEAHSDYLDDRYYFTNDGLSNASYSNKNNEIYVPMKHVASVFTECQVDALKRSLRPTSQDFAR
ncbi:hypothetical protein FOZ63_032722 [Perkinsus olseni]|uniref:Uncharacterized protein n=1 Tax=Perkinsus olseni TaxID=32597 RepID=A0A7J6R4V0_PEROL|nr:hypothetical protein FOZ63_032722 [Perkinsus olseni]KAF4729402.1 hypothetical protein FOZ62_007286 [Perkinsus olseni]